MSLLNIHLANAAVLKEILPIENIWSIYISRDGKTAGIRLKGQEDLSQIIQFQNVGKGQVRDATTWQVIQEFNNAKILYISPDSTIVGVVFANGLLHIVNLKNGEIIKEFSNVWNMTFSPNGKIACVVFNNETKFYETEQWQLIKEFQDTEPTWQLFSPDSTFVGITFADNTAHYMRVEDWHVLQKFTNVANFGLYPSADNNYLAVTYKNKTAQLVEIDNWSVIKEFNKIEKLGFIHNSKNVWALFTNKTLQIIDRDTLQVMFEQPHVVYFDGSYDAKYAWVILADTSVRVFDMETGKILLQDIYGGEECCFSPIKKEIAIALSHELRIYDLSA